jgi:hypothetical protein
LRSVADAKPEIAKTIGRVRQDALVLPIHCAAARAGVLAMLRGTTQSQA